MDEPKIPVMRELFRRYADAFAVAWKSRYEGDASLYLPHEAQFLPSALSLRETPTSPAPHMTMWSLMIFAFLVLLWAVFGKVDIVATAFGKIVTDERSKVIQPMETAIVKAIHVTDGQMVKAGDEVIDLDATTEIADRDRIESDLEAARLQVARSNGLLEAVRTGKPVRFLSLQRISVEKTDKAQRLLEGQSTEFLANLARIDADISKREAELYSEHELVKKLEQTVPIAIQHAEDFRKLVDEHFISKYGYLEREQVRIEQEADLAMQRSRLKEIGSALLEAKMQKAALIAETRRTTLESLEEAELKIANLREELIKAQTRVRFAHLTAPVDGTVQQLAVHTIGGVVTPAQQLMVIVPRDNPLEVEAFLENKDIGFVSEGQDAEVKVETFPYTKYGTIHAIVTHVSHDAINDEKRGLIYSTRVKMRRTTMQVEGKTVNLAPGMAVAVEIKTGKRRVIEYFLSPLLQYSSESLRER